MQLDDVAKIAKTALMVGSTFPAYKALFDQVVEAFAAEPDKQAALQRSYEEAIGGAEAAHRDAQAV